MSSLRATVRYDGSTFSGWQVQPDQRTVQGTIETALETIAQRPVRIMGAGRTDTGVHALGQVCSFAWDEESDLDALRRSLCKMLGPEIRIETLDRARAGFNALRDATGKTYAYAFCEAKHPDPFTNRYAWNLPYAIDKHAVLRLAQTLVGTHDFAGFCGSGSSAQTTVRTVHDITLHEGPVVGPVDAENSWHLRFHGNGFLYKMIRNITGTVIDVARGHLGASAIDERLHAPIPYRGFTAPPQGLFLVEVDYEDR